MIEGSCLCGAVRFQLKTDPGTLGICHCTRCRKAGASAIVFVKQGDVTWLQGRELVTRYIPEPPYKYERCFCSRCGTSFGEILSDEETFAISANALDGDLGLKVKFHEFVAEKPGWCEIGDEARQFEGHPG